MAEASLIAWIALGALCSMPSQQHALEQADTVFEGRVLVTEPTRSGTLVRMQVVQRWKGGQAEQVELHLAPTTFTSVEPAYLEGQSYLVYAKASARADAEQAEKPQSLTPERTQLFTDPCSRSMPIALAEQDLLQMGMAVVPFDPAQHTEDFPSLEQNEEEENTGDQDPTE